MRQLSITALLISLSLATTICPSYSALKSGIQYSIPIDYSQLSEEELANKADFYYFNAKQIPGNKVDENTTNALMIYTILQNINPSKIEYSVKLGILYDKLDKDRYAKGNFSRAIKTSLTNPEPYFYFGEYYYRRESYRDALRYYKKAYKYGFDKNYNLLYRMGDIYEKFGDSRSALKYLQAAQEENPNPDLENKIKRIENFDSSNKEFYSNTRIRS